MKRKSGEMDHIAFIDELADNKRQKEENGEMGEATDGNSNNSSAPKKRVNQSPHWFLTWNNYTIGEMETLIKEFDRLCYTYVFQEEIGKKSGIPHLQGCFSFHKPCRWSEFGFGKGPHWERVGTAKKGKFASRKTGLTNAREYCCKEDTRKPGTFPYTKNYDLKEEMEISIRFKPRYPLEWANADPTSLLNPIYIMWFDDQDSTPQAPFVILTSIMHWFKDNC